MSGRVVRMRQVLITLAVVTLSCVVFGQEEYCITPTGVDGACVLLDHCEKLKKLIHGTTLDREILKQWHCGFVGDIPMVCCAIKTPTTPSTTTAKATSTAKPVPPEDRCVTLEGTYGTCVKLDSCPKVAKRLIEAAEEDLEYVQRSRCIGLATYSVCCDKPMDGNPRLTTKKPGNGLDRYSTNNILCTSKPGLPDPKKDCCGVDSASGNKIIYGVPASIDQYPWLAMIEYTRDYLCGGSLISSEYVVTAAHCLLTTAKKTRGAKSVRLGEYNTTNNGPDCIEVEGGGFDCTLGAISIPIASTIVHPDYNAEKVIVQSNDIALIKLEKMAPYNDFIRPICLPTSDLTLTPNMNTRFYVAGWGAVDEQRKTSDIKLHIDLPFIDQAKCQELYSREGVSLVWDKQMCAGGEFNKDSCKGDSGGPLMYLDENKYQLTGVISFGVLQCGNQNNPSIYTKVYDYVPWIKSVVMP